MWAGQWQSESAQLGSPARLALLAAKSQAELLPVMASQALASGSPGNNPRVPTSDEIIGLYRRVYG